MSPIGWYYTRGSKRFGPVSAGELKQLAEHGELGAGELVWREGMEQWIPAHRVKGLFDQEVTAVKEEPAAAPTPALAEAKPVESPDAFVPLGNQLSSAGTAQTTFESSPSAFERAREGSSRHLFDWLLESLRPAFNMEFVWATGAMFTWIGRGVLYAVMVLFLGIEIALAVQGSSPWPVLLGFAGVAVLAVLQYAAGRFAGVLERLDHSAVSPMPSAVFLDSFALLSFVAGLSSLVGWTVYAVATRDFGWIPPAVIAFILFQYLAVVALNPEALHLAPSSEGTPGEEAVGILSFVIKLGLRATPVVFGVGVLWGGVLLGYTVFLLAVPSIGDHAKPDLGPDFLTLGLGQRGTLPTTQVTAIAAGVLAAVAAACPLVAYFAFAFGQLMIELLRALLALPVAAEHFQERSKGERN